MLMGVAAEAYDLRNNVHFCSKSAVMSPYRNNVDDATPYKSIIVTPAYWRKRREPFETVAARQINPVTDEFCDAVAWRAVVPARAQTWAQPGWQNL
jgi:hypothetical protein